MKDNVAPSSSWRRWSSPRTRRRGSGSSLCVANTHIHANTELNDVKLWQVHTLLKGLEKIAASAEIPMVVCGDFNSCARPSAVPQPR